eukprot:Sspe_Gene.1979::Locus_669_Transcript_1_1_Confidence_1.000_Length_2220::g.1979::m.1979
MSEMQDEAKLVEQGQAKRTPEPWFMRVADDLMPAGFGERVDKAFEVFRKTPDWHPGSDEQVLDLVHPSLYCYVGEEKQEAKKRKVSSHVMHRPASEVSMASHELRDHGTDGGEAALVYQQHRPSEARERGGGGGGRGARTLPPPNWAVP